MKCPYCNQEMITGFLSSGREVYFSKKTGGLFHGMGGDVRLTKKNLTTPQAEAYRCINSHFVLVWYDKNEVR